MSNYNINLTVCLPSESSFAWFLSIVSPKKRIYKTQSSKDKCIHINILHHNPPFDYNQSLQFRFALAIFKLYQNMSIGLHNYNKINK